jgi:hypothetical protein
MHTNAAAAAAAVRHYL